MADSFTTTSAGGPNGAGEPGLRERVVELIERGKLDDALALLKDSANGDAGNHGLLGIVHFLREDYENAAAEFSVAERVFDPVEKRAWQCRLRLARANAKAKLALLSPKARAFDAAALLAPPPVTDQDLPAPPPGRPRRTAYVAAGAVLGKVIDVVWRGVGPVAKLLRERTDSLWTDWDEQSLPRGLVSLASMRERLEKNNLFDPYPKGARTAFQDPTLPRPSATRSFRTPDGSWNDPGNPREGSANVRFPRNVAPQASVPEQGNRLMDPNPAIVSQKLLARGDEGMKPAEFLNLHAAAWIQFMVHDWVSHRVYDPDAGKSKTLDVELPKDHSIRIGYHQPAMRVGRTMSDPTRRAADGDAPPNTINEVTSWWDGSQLYGSDQATTEALRSRVDGKLALDGEYLKEKGGIEQTGFNRNWWVGLSLMHTLFAREHNAICDALKAANPTWDDDRLFNVARLVNAAVMAKIHTVEWTPAILPNRTAKVALESNWYGLVENRLFRKERKVLRRVKIRQGVFGGLVGNPVEKHGKPYGLSEEFVEVYRLHELLPDSLEIRHTREPARIETLMLAETRGAAVPELVREHGMPDLLYSFGTQHPGRIELNNYPSTLRELAVPGAPVLDLAAVDILRGRERGVPRYNDFRRELGLRPIRRFGDLTKDRNVVKALREVYQDVDDIDMIVGTRAEEDRPKGFGFGETLFQIFILNASRRLQADHFFTDGYNVANYTQEGLDWIDRATFKSVLLRHHGELAHTGLANVTNAFEPWDTDPVMDPTRHPLESLDRPGALQRSFEGVVLSGGRVKAALSRVAQAADEAFTRVRAVAYWGASYADNLPPGSFGLPMLGESLRFIGGPGPFLEERFRKHGDIFKTHVAFKPIVCLGGPDAYSFFMNEKYFTRVKGAPWSVRRLFNEKSLSFMDGPPQRRVQRLLLQAFENPALERYLPGLDSLLSQALAAWEREKTFAWLPKLEQLSFSIIDCVIMGASPTAPGAVSVGLFDRLTRGVVKSPFSPQLYLALAIRPLFVRYAKRVIARRKETQANDVVSELLRPGREGAVDHLTDEELCIELVHFFLAGAPLQAALAYHLLLLAQHPEAMRKARDEVQEIWPNGPLDLARLQSLKYVEQTCKESRRMARLVPNTFFAVVKKEFDFGGYHVPKGWRAMGLITCTQHDARNFQDPEKYDPGRFHRDRLAADCPMYVAHGGDQDPHRCIGERFADLVMTLLTAKLLQRYTWELVPGQDLGPRHGKVAPVPAGGLQVVFRPLS